MFWYSSNLLSFCICIGRGLVLASICCKTLARQAIQKDAKWHDKFNCPLRIERLNDTFCLRGSWGVFNLKKRHMPGLMPKRLLCEDLNLARVAFFLMLLIDGKVELLCDCQNVKLPKPLLASITKTSTLLRPCSSKAGLEDSSSTPLTLNMWQSIDYLQRSLVSSCHCFVALLGHLVHIFEHSLLPIVEPWQQIYGNEW